MNQTSMFADLAPEQRARWLAAVQEIMDRA